MREIPRLCRFGAVCSGLLFAAAATTGLSAQTAPAASVPKVTAPGELNQTELLDAYQNLREQLKQTQTAIINHRFETEAAARAQSAAIAQKLDAMNKMLAVEKQNREAETDRFEFERERQQSEIQHAHRTVIWIACAFGSLGLLAMLWAAVAQWRAIKHMAEIMDQREPLPELAESTLRPIPTALLPTQAAALSTQRLMSAIERMEQRIKALDQPHPPSPAPPTPPAQPREMVV